ncbi:hypothetical protein [Erythrobacter aureus]|nr:hypothetical protein [Erythrobacter aureus]
MPPEATPERAPTIHVGTSWPRPATETSLMPKWAGEFVSYEDWVSKATKRLTVASSLVTGAQVPAICVDAFGRRCTCGGDFMRARDEGAYPVRYFFECEEPEEEVATLQAALTWFGEHRNLELDFDGKVYGDDDEPDLWRVTEKTGSINDREWDTIAHGETPAAAIIAAYKRKNP